MSTRNPEQLARLEAAASAIAACDNMDTSEVPDVLRTELGNAMKQLIAHDVPVVHRRAIAARLVEWASVMDLDQVEDGLQKMMPEILISSDIAPGVGAPFKVLLDQMRTTVAALRSLLENLDAYTAESDLPLHGNGETPAGNISQFLRSPCVDSDDLTYLVPAIVGLLPRDSRAQLLEILATEHQIDYKPLSPKQAGRKSENA